MKFMEEAGIFKKRVINTTGRLRGELTENEWQKFIQNFLKTRKAPGPDGIQNELIKTMTDNEKEVLRIWANEVLQDDNPARKMSTLVKAGMISKLHDGGATTEKRPVILLNGLNQLIASVISPRNRNRVNRNHLDQSLRSSQKNRNSLAWVLPTKKACFLGEQYSRGIA